MARPTINYGPELIDEILAAHVKEKMNFEGEVEIEYTHRRSTRKVEATIFLGASEPIEKSVVDNADAQLGDDTDATTFDTLPKHEQEEAQGIDVSEADGPAESTVGEATDSAEEIDSNEEQHEMELEPEAEAIAETDVQEEDMFADESSTEANLSEPTEELDADDDSDSLFED